MASNQIQKSTVSSSTRCTETIETANVLSLRLVFAKKLMCIYFLVLYRFVSPAAMPFTLVVCRAACGRADSDVFTKTKISRIDRLPYF